MPAKRVNKSTSDKQIRSQRELATLLGDRDVAQINRILKHDERWPFRRSAPWDRDELPQMLRWVADTLESGSSETIDDETADELVSLRKEKLRQEIRRLRTLADADEMDTAEKRRRLIPVEEIKVVMVRAATTFRNRVIGAGAAVTPSLEGRDAAERQTILDEYHGDILRQLEVDLRGMC